MDEQELADLIGDTYANEFHDPAGHAARAILRKIDVIREERNSANQKAARYADERNALLEVLNRAAWSVPENTSVGELLLPYRKLTEVAD